MTQTLLIIIIIILVAIIFFVLIRRGVNPRDIEGAVLSTWNKLGLDEKMA